MAAPIQPQEAVARILAEARRMPAEEVALAAALGRVTAADQVAERDVPGFDNSAMDGFAVRSEDCGSAGAGLRIVGESRAGAPAPAGPGRGEAVRISTGAMVPAGADAVIPLEEVEEEDGALRTRIEPRRGDHVRRAGEDLRAGEVAVAAGARLGAAELGVIAATGADRVRCARRPAAALFSSGDELVPPGAPAGPGQVHDANLHSVAALLAAAGAEVVRSGKLADELAATEAALGPALGLDLLVVCGGVSVGRHDHVKEALAALGVERLFWRVAVRPGKPTWAGVSRREDGHPTLVFGLPGNPVSAMVTFHLFVRPALRAMLGLDPPVPPRASAILAEPYRKSAGRTDYVRCRLEQGEDGPLARITDRPQRSHVLTSMLGADALALMPAGRETIAAGERVEVEPLSP